jgi:Zn-dependent peptidase ImmA (M78 family)
MKELDIIQIGNREFAIVQTDDEVFDHYLLKAGVELNDLRDIKSFVDYDENMILIRKRLDENHKRELLIHELLHASLEVQCIPQDESTEKFITMISPRVYELFKNGLSEILYRVEI